MTSGASQAFKYFYLSLFWLGMAELAIPLYFPITSEEKGLTGLQIGAVISLRGLVSILVTPIIEKMTEKVSCEFTILLGVGCNALAFTALAFSDFVESPKKFMALSSLFVSLLGVAGASMIIGENCLLLRYSPKSERENTVGMFRMINGMGGMCAPVICSIGYAISGISFCYGIFAIGFFILSPLIFFKLRSARECWHEENRKLDLVEK